MKLVSLLILMIVAVSCGQDGGGGSSSSAQKEGLCQLNGRAVACESIQGADGLGIDLLDAMIDVPVKVENAEITFLSDKSAVSTGRRITCKAAVKNGEVYRFALRGNRLLLMTGSGSYEMDRLTDGDSLMGTWAWKGYEDQGVHMIRQLTFLTNSRVIMRTSCEL